MDFFFFLGGGYNKRCKKISIARKYCMKYLILFCQQDEEYREAAANIVPANKISVDAALATA